MKQYAVSIVTICLFLSLLALTSCGNDESNLELTELGEIYLVFGHFFGECAGESCVETYALTSDKLFEDSLDSYNQVEFEFGELSDEKFDLVTGLENLFPNELLTVDQEVFGCPDCGDWGGIYVELVENGERYIWRIDVNLDDIPLYLHDFVTEIIEKIRLINQ